MADPLPTRHTPGRELPKLGTARSKCRAPYRRPVVTVQPQRCVTRSDSISRSCQHCEIIDRSPLRDPQVPVVTNIAGQVCTSADHIRTELASQMVAPVEWVGSVREMVANGVDTFVEIGPGHTAARPQVLHVPEPTWLDVPPVDLEGVPLLYWWHALPRAAPPNVVWSVRA
jgi:hypothetical protein